MKNRVKKWSANGNASEGPIDVYLILEHFVYQVTARNSYPVYKVMLWWESE